ncbi:hypothetical protein, partial [Bacillus altitudinis]|uniref:hypothetical protein n=1 Tax=Bacillus altitudinis TaxID=293387 RepID=UPI002F926A51
MMIEQIMERDDQKQAEAESRKRNQANALKEKTDRLTPVLRENHSPSCHHSQRVCYSTGHRTSS